MAGLGAGSVAPVVSWGFDGEGLKFDLAILAQPARR